MELIAKTDRKNRWEDDEARLKIYQKRAELACARVHFKLTKVALMDKEGVMLHEEHPIASDHKRRPQPEVKPFYIDILWKLMKMSSDDQRRVVEGSDVPKTYKKFVKISPEAQELVIKRLKERAQYQESLTHELREALGSINKEDRFSEKIQQKLQVKFSIPKPYIEQIKDIRVAGWAKRIWKDGITREEKYAECMKELGEELCKAWLTVEQQGKGTSDQSEKP